MNRELDYQKVAKLRDGETTYIFWSEGGGGQVERVGDKLFVYDVPIYGGIPQLEGVYSIFDYRDVVDFCWTWT